jgi:hypothetical protein
MGEIVREEMAGGERTVSLERRRSKEFGGEEVKKLGSNDEIVRTRGAAVLRPYMIEARARLKRDGLGGRPEKKGADVRPHNARVWAARS